MVVLIFSLRFILVRGQPQPHTADMFLKIVDYSETPIPFLKVIIKTTEDTKLQYSATDSKGNLRFEVTTGNSYKVYVFDTVFISTQAFSYTACRMLHKKFC